MSNAKISTVKDFWEKNPLFTGESSYEVGTKKFFEEHRRVVIEDCLAGNFDKRTIPTKKNSEHVLDLGCGPGFWTIELMSYNLQRITAADLTQNALELCKKRCEIFNVKAEFSQENAESLSFEDDSFTHVNCQGVIHHTPNTEKCISEIARVLKAGGSASISVYYKNFFLRNWFWLRYLGKLLYLSGSKLNGRGRETIFNLSDSNEIVRMYDGAENPIGKAYSKKEFLELLSEDFVVKETYLHFFPSRSLPFPLPKVIHRYLDSNFGFMIYATCEKK